MLKGLLKRKKDAASLEDGSRDTDWQELDSEIRTAALDDSRSSRPIARVESMMMTTPAALSLANAIASEAAGRRNTLRKYDERQRSQSIFEKHSPAEVSVLTCYESDDHAALVKAEVDSNDTSEATDEEKEKIAFKETESVEEEIPKPPRKRRHFNDVDLFLIYLRETTSLEVPKEVLERNCSDLFESTDETSHVLYEEGQSPSKFRIIKMITDPSEPVGEDGLHELVRYRHLWSPSEMAELLLFRYNTTPPESCTSFSDLGEWSVKQQSIEKLTTEVIIAWVETYFEKDIKDNIRTQELIQNFLTLFLQGDTKRNDDSVPRLTCALSPHLSLRQFGLDKKLQGKRKKKKKAKAYQGSLNFIDMNPSEIARQLTLIEYDLFNSISTTEFVNQGWSRADKEVTSPNILNMIRRFNHVCSWVAFEILAHAEIEKRAIALSRFIVIGNEFRKLKNFNGVMTIVSALQQICIWRLKQTWELLPYKVWDMWDEMILLMDNAENFGAYRKALANSSPPTVPYLGTILTDFTMTDDGNPNLYPGTDLANVKKLQLQAKVVFRIVFLRSKGYTFKPVNEIRVRFCCHHISINPQGFSSELLHSP